MIATKPTPNEVITDTWLMASWDEFVAIAHHPNFDKARYWVVDVNVGKVIAFEMKDGWSHQIHDSQVLPGLAIATLEEALQRSQTEDDGAINRWLLETFTHILHQNPEARFCVREADAKSGFWVLV